MFDHGLDCISLGLLIVIYLRTLQVGFNFIATMFTVSLYMNFYMAILTSYYTGQLILPVLNGHSDGALMLTALTVVVGVFGNGVFTTQISEVQFLNWSGVSTLTLGQLTAILITVANVIFSIF
jgi:ethanolaminephosphotransferase